MGKHIDLTGHRFGRWIVVSYAGDRRWNCRCDCTNEQAVIGANLRNGRSRSCGCLAREQGREQRPETTVDEAGNKYGRLLVDRRSPKISSAGAYWICNCDCDGKEVEVLGKHLRNGTTRSCGCLRTELATDRIREISTGKKGKEHPRWKGDDIDYRYAHVWVSRHKKKQGICFLHGEKVAYTEWANRRPDRKLSRDPDDYIEVCKPCHMRLDGHPWVKKH